MKTKKFGKNIIYDEKGVNSIELIIILAVLVTLAFVFKDFIIELANSIFNKISTKTEKNIDDLAKFAEILMLAGR